MLRLSLPRFFLLLLCHVLGVLRALLRLRTLYLRRFRCLLRLCLPPCFALLMLLLCLPVLCLLFLLFPLKAPLLYLALLLSGIPSPPAAPLGSYFSSADPGPSAPSFPDDSNFDPDFADPSAQGPVLPLAPSVPDSVHAEIRRMYSLCGGFVSAGCGFSCSSSSSDFV